MSQLKIKPKKEKQSSMEQLTTEQKLQVRELQLQISQVANVKFQMDIQFRTADTQQKELEEKLKNLIDSVKPEGEYTLLDDLTRKKVEEAQTP
jgi:hypothetical protein